MRILYRTLPPRKCLSYEEVSPHDLISSPDSLIRIITKILPHLYLSKVGTDPVSSTGQTLSLSKGRSWFDELTTNVVEQVG